jgi:hypothetical protein
MSAQARWAVTAIGSIALVTVIGACTSSGGGTASVGTGGRAQAKNDALAPVHGAVAAGAASAPASGSAGGGGGGAVAPSTSTADTGYGGTFTSVQLGGAKIRIVQMTVQVKRGASVADQANAAEAIVMGAGGEVDADDRSSGRYAQATMVLKVPPEQLTAVLSQLSKLGIEKGRRESTQDVTARVADVRSRVDSAQQEIARLRVLYGHASKISDVIRIESELAQREGNLESLQAQQRALAAETTTATVTLTLTSPPPITKKVEKPVKHTHHDSGFLAGLKGGWHAFTGGLSVLATVIGAVLPFAILLILLALLARLLWPRFGPRLRRTPAPAAAAPPQ